MRNFYNKTMIKKSKISQFVWSADKKITKGFVCYQILVILTFFNLSIKLKVELWYLTAVSIPFILSALSRLQSIKHCLARYVNPFQTLCYPSKNNLTTNKQSLKYLTGLLPLKLF